MTDSHGNPAASASPTGLSPATIKSVYGFPTDVTASPLPGAGETIAIVDAYDDPTAASDLNTFSSQFGLPACTTANGCFEKVNETGGTSYPSTDSGWALEISLDIQWAHAIAPGAKILLVEASSSSLLDLLTAESYATAHAAYVSNSWGASEFSGENLFDSYFSGSSVFVSAGDSGLPAEWPSAAPDVISVGGTTLAQNSDGTWSETGWSWNGTNGGGGGCSTYETATPAQSSFSQYSQVKCGGMRATPDVALDANPNSGVSIYDSTPYQGQSGWFTVGGTSVSSPIWAAASADSGQTVNSKYVYANNINFNDVTSGNNGAPCLVGYDLCTGRGSWIYSSSSLLSGGGGSTQSPDFTISASPSSQTVTQGGSASYTVSTSSLNNDTSSVDLKVGGLPSGATTSFSVNPVSPGSSSTLTVTTASNTPAGSYALTITGNDGTNTHTTGVTLVVQSSITQSAMNVTVSAGTVSQKGPNYWVPLTITATDSSNTGIAGASVQLGVYQGTCSGSPTAAGSGTTDSSGQATFKFRTKTAGSWCALAIVTASGYSTAISQTSFSTP